MGVSRAAAETMIKECEDADWIVIKRGNGNRRRVQAADITVETYADYCDWLWRLINESDRRSLSASINEIEKLEETFS